MSKSKIETLLCLRIGNGSLLTTYRCVLCLTCSLESADPEFDDYQRHFTALETAAEKLIKDTKAFSEAVTCKNIS